MASSKRTTRTLDALPDTVDFRDTLYIPTLVEVAPESDLDRYRALKVPVLDQGVEGACTGYGLATVAHYLLRTRKRSPSTEAVSARMLYVMAKRYDEWEGEDYEGSSARGAMKAWHKHGVAAEAFWRNRDKKADITTERAASALDRPLGAYFRVNHRDLVAMHSAISETGVLFATASVHEGWMKVKAGDRDIAFKPGVVGGHAFAIVGYDRHGFWIQNSWGPDWGSGGLARLCYDDWLANGTDVWAARLGVPADLAGPTSAAAIGSSSPRSSDAYLYADLRPHIVTADNDGLLRSKGVYGLTPAGLKEIVRVSAPDVMAGWSNKRVLVYAHGGLHPESHAIEYVARYRAQALQRQVYPISVIWRSDLFTTIGDILADAFSRRRDEGVLQSATDFMLDRVDDTLEPLARLLGGKALWDEMKENAQGCTDNAGGAARLLADNLADGVRAGEIDEVHLAGHSAGSILLAPFARRLKAKGVKVKSLSLWAPACTLKLFEDVYAPMVQDGSIEAIDVYTLDDDTERGDDCAHIYNKSLLYLVSAAFEKTARIPLIRPIGERLLGLARDVAAGIPKGFWTGVNRRWLLAPASAQSGARHHGDFDNDPETLQATLARVTGQVGPSGAAKAPRSPSPMTAAGRARMRDRLQLVGLR